MPDRDFTRKLGPIRKPGTGEGLTRKMAEARLRELMAEVTVRPLVERITVEQAGERLIEHLITKGRKASTTAGYESNLRVHLAPPRGRHRARRSGAGRCRGDSRAQQRCGHLCEEIVRHRGHGVRANDHAVRVPAVEPPVRPPVRVGTQDSDPADAAGAT